MSANVRISGQRDLSEVSASVMKLSGDIWSGLPETSEVMKSIYTNEQWIGLGSGAAAAAAETYEKLGLEKLVAQGREKVEKG